MGACVRIPLWVSLPCVAVSVAGLGAVAAGAAGLSVTRGYLTRQTDSSLLACAGEAMGQRMADWPVPVPSGACDAELLSAGGRLVAPPTGRGVSCWRRSATSRSASCTCTGRLTLAELDERAGAALSARTICELAALIADLSGPWTPVPASAPRRVPPPASPVWASRAPERWSLLQSLADRAV